jgi:glycine cleavage system T protein (aminomethyltransferase)
VEPIDAVAPGTRTGPFHERQRALGATFYEDTGWLWTRSFGEPLKEYWAVRRDAGLWDVSALVKWRFTGPDTLTALDRISTRKTIALAPGTVRYGMVLNDDGLLLDEGTTLVLSPEEAFYFGNDERSPFEEHLRREIARVDVQVENVTDRMPNVAVQGPRSFEVVSSLTDADVSSLKWFRMIPEPVAVAGVEGYLARTGFTGELGYEFFLLEPGGAERLWDALTDAGATPIGLDAVELLRIEAGLLIQEEDYRPGETDPYELNLDGYIELEAHDFVGRTAAAVSALNPPRRFATLQLDGDRAPEPGSRVTKDGADVGDVRSAAVTPRFGALALAVVDANVALGGGRIAVGGSEGIVRDVPIDDPTKLRPRSDPLSPVTIDAVGQTS